ncbi:MAG: hypothetical protein P1U63_10875 [Coxiellaceae bacterium]|nr:hypothetical protein [Coxiellaceae bacterium]
MAIVVVVDGSLAGSGDFRFADKVAHWLREQYPRLDVHVVTRNGALYDRAQSLGFSDFLSHEAFSNSHGYGKTPIDLIVEGPFHGPWDLCGSLDRDLLEHLGLSINDRSRQSIPLVMLNEYSHMDTYNEREPGECPRLLPIEFTTGFSDTELGVIQRRSVTPDESKDAASELDVTAGRAGFVYCHQRHDFERYIQLHKAVSADKTSFVIGKMACKFAQQYQQKHPGKFEVIDTSQHITAESSIQDVQRYLASLDERQKYRLICFPQVKPEVMAYLQQRSGDFVCATGDQSFIEVMQRDKVITYSTETHKVEFRKGYMAQMQRRLSAEAFELLSLINPEPILGGPLAYIHDRPPISVPALTRNDKARASELFNKRHLVQEIKQAQRHLLRQKNLFQNIQPAIDKRILPARVRTVLTRNKDYADVKQSIRHFLDQLEQTAPKNRRAICFWPSAHRRRVDDFILTMRTNCASGSLQRHDSLKHVFDKELKGLVNDLVKQKSVRTISCVQAAADSCFLKRYQAPTLAESGVFYESKSLQIEQQPEPEPQRQGAAPRTRW